jgi:KGK domain
MNEDFKALDEFEIISLIASPLCNHLSLNSNGFDNINLTTDEFKKTISRKISIPEDIRKKILHTGLDCEVLKFQSKEWLSGKIKIKLSIEFCPNEDELEKLELAKSIELEKDNIQSPLDDLRNIIH